MAARDGFVAARALFLWVAEGQEAKALLCGLSSECLVAPNPSARRAERSPDRETDGVVRDSDATTYPPWRPLL